MPPPPTPAGWLSIIAQHTTGVTVGDIPEIFASRNAELNLCTLYLPSLNSKLGENPFHCVLLLKLLNHEAITYENCA